MNFPDTATLKLVTGHDDWGRPQTQEITLPCAYEQTTGVTHAGYADTVAGTPVLYLPPDDQLAAIGYRLEGTLVSVDSYTQEDFKVVSVSPIRDTLLENQVRHVECELQKVDVPQEATS